MKTGAVLSPCGTYRYRLWRSWDPTRQALPFIMLNPSTADAEKDDPTIRKCCGFAQRMGYGGIEIANLFAYRATKPKDLPRISPGPVGPNNDNWLAALATVHGPQVVCAWGANGALWPGRVAEVLKLLRLHGVMPMALALTDDGHPWHPLMLSYDLPDGTPRQLIPLQ